MIIFLVLNFGASGAEVTRKSSYPYWVLDEYEGALSSHPHIVVIQFGTNDFFRMDKKKYNDAKFVSNYVELIHNFQVLVSKPTVYINTPSPFYADKSKNAHEEYYNRMLNIELPSVTRRIADLTGAILIDNFEAFGGLKYLNKPGTMKDDKVHPNNLGYTIMAHNIASVIISHENFTLIRN
jgi:lysophospholipase L1-like esterase